MTLPRSSFPFRESPVYGPIRSWRFGMSLGIDLLLRSSICSFGCVYCQLGKIHQLTTRQEVFVPTETVLEALRKVRWEEVDVATFSGSGEPTLALNLGEVIDGVKAIAGKPVVVLTNATQFQDAATRRRVLKADRVVCKLDVASDRMLRIFNRPASGITIEGVVEGIRNLRREYTGTLCLQCMFMPLNLGEVEGIGRLAASIGPDEVQINTPQRMRPGNWILEARGQEAGSHPIEGVSVPTVSMEELERVEATLRRLLPGVPLVNISRHRER